MKTRNILKKSMVIIFASISSSYAQTAVSIPHSYIKQLELPESCVPSTESVSDESQELKSADLSKNCIESINSNDTLIALLEYGKNVTETVYEKLFRQTKSNHSLPSGHLEYVSVFNLKSTLTSAPKDPFLNPSIIGILDAESKTASVLNINGEHAVDAPMSLTESGEILIRNLIKSTVHSCKSVSAQTSGSEKLICKELGLYNGKVMNWFLLELTQDLYKINLVKSELYSKANQRINYIKRYNEAIPQQYETMTHFIKYNPSILDQSPFKALNPRKYYGTYGDFNAPKFVSDAKALGWHYWITFKKNGGSQSQWSRSESTTEWSGSLSQAYSLQNSYSNHGSGGFIDRSAVNMSYNMYLMGRAFR